MTRTETIEKTKEIQSPGETYLQWFYDQHIWKHMSYRGVRTLKYPQDMWNYQEIIFERGIHWIIEAGTRHGGSALFFGDLLLLANVPGGVVTIDTQPELMADIEQHSKIQLFVGDSASEEFTKQLYSQLPEDRGPLLLILDSDHSKDHVLRELHAHVKYLKANDYVIVEDTVINGHPVRPDFGPGPMEAVEEFLKTEQGKRLDYDQARAEKFGLSMADKGYFVVK